MVELLVDDYYTYTDHDKNNIPVIGPYGGNISVRLPVSSKPQLYLGQDESIFCSTQLNESCWTMDNDATLHTEGLGTGVMVSAIVSHTMGFGLKVREE